ncbi:MAG: galactose-1-phosphate uridylyltransferase [Deltaproteobacteria bacterium]|nr:galactose-1-phosphate uridylyltransferase [Deltaproteobacteria bacterium]
MPELRKDPIIGRWVIISTDRGRRPADFIVPKPETRGGFCPFCPGNEDKTPPEILAYTNDRINNKESDSNGDWHIRVIPNKFPALRVEGELERVGDGVYDMISGIGAHEIIIDSPNHDDTLATISTKQFEEMLWAYISRLKDLRRDTRLRYVLIFKNHGEAAGASLEHTHSQLIALPIIPKRVAEELDGSLSYYKYKERCIFCDIIRQELMQKSRVVSENKHFLAVTPYAPKSPFEMWLLPKEHCSNFEDTTDKHMSSLAEIFSEVLKRMDKVLGNPPYNYILHSAPFHKDMHRLAHYHWHFEIMPKLTKTAGFEWGSGFYINPTPPEEAAEFLRKAKI